MQHERLIRNALQGWAQLKLAHAGLPTPEWSADGTGFKGDARVIVKPTWEHGSLGLDETSVMRGADAPRVIAARSLCLNTDHFAEAYIEGREFHIALLERIAQVEVLPIAEILFGDRETHAPKICDGYDAKWAPESPAYIGTLRRFGLEHDEPELAKMLQQFALACWTLFRFSGYARVDFRVDFDRRALHHRRKPKPVSYAGHGRRRRGVKGWAHLSGLDREHRRNFVPQTSTFATQIA